MTDPYESGFAAGEVEASVHDLDGDGWYDAVSVVDPTTGATTVGLDTDGDGELDTVLVDHDGDGWADEGHTRPGSPLDPAISGEADPTAAPTPPTSEVPGPFPTDPEQQDEPPALVEVPATDDGAATAGVYGDPQAEIEYHVAQPGPVDCLPTSVSMIVSEVTGTSVPPEEVVALAHDKGFMTEYGMELPGALELLQAYGLDATLVQGTADDLRQALQAGDEIIIGLDSADLYQGNGGPFDPGMVAGHAVELTGISDGPPAVVYINDPGFPDGAGVELPLELFLDAWADADNAMVVVSTDAAGAPGSTASTDTTSGDTATAGTAPGDTASTDTATTGTASGDTAPADAGRGFLDETLDTIKRFLVLPVSWTVPPASS